MHAYQVLLLFGSEVKNVHIVLFLNENFTTNIVYCYILDLTSVTCDFICCYSFIV